jgi:hypothetical protein
MDLRNKHELANTRLKLQELTAVYEANVSKTGGDEELRDMSMESLMRLINQLKEEIAPYEAHQVAPR